MPRRANCGHLWSRFSTCSLELPRPDAKQSTADSLTPIPQGGACRDGTTGSLKVRHLVLSRSQRSMRLRPKFLAYVGGPR